MWYKVYVNVARDIKYQVLEPERYTLSKGRSKISTLLCNTLYGGIHFSKMRKWEHHCSIIKIIIFLVDLIIQAEKIFIPNSNNHLIRFLPQSDSPFRIMGSNM